MMKRLCSSRMVNGSHLFLSRVYHHPLKSTVQTSLQHAGLTSSLPDWKLVEGRLCRLTVSPHRSSIRSIVRVVGASASLNLRNSNGRIFFPPQVALPLRSRIISQMISGGVVSGLVCGFLERSFNPSNPSLRYRSTHPTLPLGIAQSTYRQSVG